MFHAIFLKIYFRFNKHRSYRSHTLHITHELIYTLEKWVSGTAVGTDWQSLTSLGTIQVLHLNFRPPTPPLRQRNQ